MNGNDSEEEVSLCFEGKSMMVVLPEHSIATNIIR